MADDTAFRAWARPGIPGDQDVRGGARRRVRFELEGSVVPTGPFDEVDEQVEVEFPGPADVEGLTRRAIRRVSPPSGSGDAEGEFCAYVDLVASDLPWRYTGATVGGHDSLPPWLAVIAGAEGTELGLDLAGRAWMSASVTSELDPSLAATWAHVHHHLLGTPPDGEEQFQAARVLCPRRLPDNAACLAVVVPVYGRDGVQPRWQAGTFASGLPVLHAWRFHTNEAGTFLDLVADLQPGPIPDGLGVATVAADTTGGGRATAAAFGLLAPIGVTSPGDWSDPTVRGDVEARLAPAATPGELPILGLPHYGAPWVADPATTPWGRELNHDPRHRAVAALGTRAGIDWQQQIVDAAGRRLGQTHLAATMLRDLAAGVELARRLSRRVPSGSGPVQDEEGAAERLAFYGPALRKIRADRGGTALAALTGPSSPLSASLLSGAAQRLLRPGSPLARGPGPDDLPWSHGRVIARLSTCRPAPEVTLPGAEQHDRQSPHDGLREYLDETQDWSDFEGVDHIPEEVVSWDLDPRVDEVPCAPVPLVDVVGELDAAFDPGNVPVRVVLDRIIPRPTRHDVPWTVEPDLDLPAWAWLRDHAPEWILPRAGLVPPNSIVALRTNGAFLEAFLVGLSQQAVAELRWRGVPCAPSAMPMRTMWQRVRDPARDPDDVVRPDVSPVVGWDSSSGLGHPSHRLGDRDMLTIVVRSDLLRRYPDTVIRLARRKEATADRPPEPDLDPDTIVAPSAVGPIGADLWFIAFDVDPDDLGNRYLLLEETVDAPRFTPPVGVVAGDPPGHRVVRRPDGTTSEAFNGAEYARGAWARPVRAAIDGHLLVSPPPVIGGP